MKRVGRAVTALIQSSGYLTSEVVNFGAFEIVGSQSLRLLSLGSHGWAALFSVWRRCGYPWTSQTAPVN